MYSNLPKSNFFSASWLSGSARFALLDAATGLRVSELLAFAGAMWILRTWSSV